MGKFGLLLNKFKLPAVLFGTKYFFIYPNTHAKIYTVIGKKIELPKIEHPTNEEINHYHNLYLEQLT